MTRRLSWLLMAVVLAVAFVAGARDDSGPRTDAERARALAKQVRCPTCRGLSVAESDAKAASAVRDEIRTRIRAGESDAEIRSFLVSRYGREILLTPPGRGVSTIVWALPVAALVLALAGLAAVFRRWRARGAARPDADDVRLVEEALRS